MPRLLYNECLISARDYRISYSYDLTSELHRFIQNASEKFVNVNLWGLDSDEPVRANLSVLAASSKLIANLATHIQGKQLNGTIFRECVAFDFDDLF